MMLYTATCRSNGTKHWRDLEVGDAFTLGPTDTTILIKTDDTHYLVLGNIGSRASLIYHYTDLRLDQRTVLPVKLINMHVEFTY